MGRDSALGHHRQRHVPSHNQGDHHGGPFGVRINSGRRYNLSIGLQALNHFNDADLALPNGNLSSSEFGKSTQLAIACTPATRRSAASHCRPPSPSNPHPAHERGHERFRVRIVSVCARCQFTQYPARATFVSGLYVCRNSKRNPLHLIEGNLIGAPVVAKRRSLCPYVPKAFSAQAGINPLKAMEIRNSGLRRWPHFFCPTNRSSPKVAGIQKNSCSDKRKIHENSDQ